MDYQALKAELLAGHPTTGAYDADAAVAATQLNAENRPYVIPSMPGHALLDLTDPTEYQALTEGEKAQWLALTGHDTVNTEVDGMAQIIGMDIFGAGTTASNIGSARSTTVSRAVELNLGLVRAGDVEYARSI
ncbi:MAG: hypothetical protein KJN90_10605 [Gammaproteobacteria bacterium]|nr:hypothetical protein [Gammaproteobacteria bacterium]MBT8438689.1 hypothetical protein [Gammaproteobacteria bacterium]NNK57414.1 hypothetical protein [Desulfofustis sp.]